jgi:hypothetical protein
MIGGMRLRDSELPIRRLALKQSTSIPIVMGRSDTVINTLGLSDKLIGEICFKILTFNLSGPLAPYWGMSDSNIAVFAGVPDLVVPSM